MAEYKQGFDASGALVYILRNSDNAHIPIDETNRDYAAYLQWISAGGIPDAPPVITLDDVKAKKLAELQQQKGVALSAMQYAIGDETYTITLTTQDQLDVQMQIALLQAEGAGATTIWEVVNNTFMTWTAADLQALQMSGIFHVKSVYANTAALSAAIKAAPDTDTLNTIDLTQGWPA